MTKERGIPYSVAEPRFAADQPGDVYHRDLIHWAASEIDRLDTLMEKETIRSLIDAWLTAHKLVRDGLPLWTISYEMLEALARPSPPFSALEAELVNHNLPVIRPNLNPDGAGVIVAWLLPRRASQ